MDNLKDPQKPSGPVEVGDLEIVVDRDLCIGAATCSAIAPLTFALDADAKAVVLNTADQDSIETIIDAARGCPVAAIIIKRKNGEKVFPK